MIEPEAATGVNARERAAERIAIEAGQVLTEHFEHGVTADHKGRIDLVTEADRNADALIRARISDEFPDDIIVSEEADYVPAEDTVRGCSRWYVDPLDGTTNFVHGLPYWGVSIAWCSALDRTEVAVVNVPPANELFSATLEREATLNNQPIQATDTAVLHEALVASGFPYDFSGPTNLEEWADLAPKVRSMRSLGAAAVDLCQVAAGRLDAFWEQGLGRWDTTAGCLVAAQAGATVTDLSGTPIAGPTIDVVVAGPNLHPQLLAALNTRHRQDPRPQPSQD